MSQEEKKLHILLCEDDESLGMLLSEYLQAKTRYLILTGRRQNEDTQLK